MSFLREEIIYNYFWISVDVLFEVAIYMLKVLFYFEFKNNCQKTFFWINFDINACFLASSKLVGMKYTYKSSVNGCWLDCYWFVLKLNSLPQVFGEKYLSCLNRALYWIWSLWINVWLKQIDEQGLCFKTQHESLLTFSRNIY